VAVRHFNRQAATNSRGATNNKDHMQLQTNSTICFPPNDGFGMRLPCSASARRHSPRRTSNSSQAAQTTFRFSRSDMTWFRTNVGALRRADRA
jgi:hypothetical protein